MAVASVLSTSIVGANADVMPTAWTLASRLARLRARTGPVNYAAAWAGAIPPEKAAILAGLFVPVSLRTASWILALVWMGAAHVECGAVIARIAAILYRHGRVGDGAWCGARDRRHSWMDLFGRDHPRRKRAYMAGYRASMGKVLVARQLPRPFVPVVSSSTLPIEPRSLASIGMIQMRFRHQPEV